MDKTSVVRWGYPLPGSLPFVLFFGMKRKAAEAWGRLYLSTGGNTFSQFD